MLSLWVCVNVSLCDRTIEGPVGIVGPTGMYGLMQIVRTELQVHNSCAHVHASVCAC